MAYEAIRLIVSDFHVVRGQTIMYSSNRFGYQLGGSHVFDTGDMRVLETDPNYLCSPFHRYKIKIRSMSGRPFKEIFVRFGRGDQIETDETPNARSSDDIDADAALLPIAAD